MGDVPELYGFSNSGLTVQVETLRSGNAAGGIGEQQLIRFERGDLTAAMAALKAELESTLAEDAAVLTAAQETKLAAFAARLGGTTLGVSNLQDKLQTALRNALDLPGRQARAATAVRAIGTARPRASSRR